MLSEPSVTVARMWNLVAVSHETVIDNIAVTVSRPLASTSLREWAEEYFAAEHDLALGTSSQAPRASIGGIVVEAVREWRERGQSYLSVQGHGPMGRYWGAAYVTSPASHWIYSIEMDADAVDESAPSVFERVLHTVSVR
jgi:hypothetical protein